MICPLCDGTGWEDPITEAWPQPCRMCGGSGQLFIGGKEERAKDHNLEREGTRKMVEAFRAFDKALDQHINKESLNEKSK